jgi:histidinol phosphatase-like enzyme (inositol monophosphatase family)
LAAPAVDPSLLEEAVALLRHAGAITLRWFRAEDQGLEWKADGTPVTAADKAAERFLREQLAARHPGDGVLGEEEAPTEGTSGRRWILDPVDGTKAFSRGVPTYSNLLALEDEHGLAIGVINLPGLGETVFAGRGLGCWSLTPAGERVLARVSDRTELAGSVVTTSGYDAWSAAALVAVHGTGASLRTWGDGWGYALVATGRVEAMVDPVAAPYDLAPAPVILAEAGGRFTDLTGAERIDGGHGIATNGALHEALLGHLRP